MAYRIRTLDEHFTDDGPKRILALDGGGVRGILSLGFLARLESLLRARYGGDAGFRLCHYFDLIAGTSTGAIIAACLARGMTVEEITERYRKLGRDVFRFRRFGGGMIWPLYGRRRLVGHLRRTLGEETTLGSATILTGLLMVTKRTDTGSPWPLGNNPRGRFFIAGVNDDWISNADYPLWKVVRASTAAPRYFRPERITIAQQPGRKPVIGDFVDGGVSPFNNPALQALMYATFSGYCVGWRTGKDDLLLVSIGTGTADPGRPRRWISSVAAIEALLGLMDDGSTLVETMLQWMSRSPTAREIDLELGDLGGDLLGPDPLLRYLRYDVPLTREGVDRLVPGLTDQQIRGLRELDDPRNLDLLHELGIQAAAAQIRGDHLPPRFDLVPAGDA